jgi:hypothetical protein
LETKEKVIAEKVTLEARRVDAEDQANSAELEHRINDLGIKLMEMGIAMEMKNGKLLQYETDMSNCKEEAAKVQDQLDEACLAHEHLKKDSEENMLEWTLRSSSPPPRVL